MAILSVDLAFRRWTDLGIVVLERGRAPGGPVVCEVLPWDEPGPVQAEVLAGRLNHLCGIRNIRILMLDGPQAWKSTANESAHARLSERLLNTAAKTGLPGMVKPVTYRAFCGVLRRCARRHVSARLEADGIERSAQEFSRSHPDRELPLCCMEGAWDPATAREAACDGLRPCGSICSSESCRTGDRESTSKSRPVAGDRRRAGRARARGPGSGRGADRWVHSPARRRPLARGVHRCAGADPALAQRALDELGLQSNR